MIFFFFFFILLLISKGGVDYCREGEGEKKEGGEEGKNEVQFNPDIVRGDPIAR